MSSIAEFVNYTQDLQRDPTEVAPPSADEPQEDPDHTISAPDVQAQEITLDDLMGRIRHHVLVNRRRVGTLVLLDLMLQSVNQCTSEELFILIFFSSLQIH